MSVISKGTDPYSYVKFVRGTPTAYANLADKRADTLYFISAAGASSGTLYLGDKIIGGASSLNQLTDILMSGVGDRQILSYDASSNKWINRSLQEIIGEIMTGATASSAGTAGLVPAPAAGDQNKFLRGDGTWATVQAGDLQFDHHVFDATGSNVTLKDFTAATAGSVLQKDSNNNISWVSPTIFTADLQATVTALQATVNGLQGGLRYTIVPSIASIDTSSADATKYIYLILKDNQDLTTGNMYDEYMVINGNIELIGTNFGGSASGFVTQSDFDTAVGSLNAKFNNYVTLSKYNSEVGDLTQLLKSTSQSDTLVDQVNFLTDRLIWYNVIDE